MSVLGGFELRQADGVVKRLPTRKAEALLAYLALQADREHSREALAALLWPDAAVADARATLRQTLALVKKMLGPGVLVTTARTLGLAAGMLQADAAEFDDLADDASLEAAERAAALYRGDLLGTAAIGAAPFEEWLRIERERLRRRLLVVLGRLADCHAERADPVRAIEVLQRLLAIDPLDEAAHRALMRQLAGLGRRGAALRQYETCVDILRRELDAEPARETRDLFDAVLRQRGTEADASPDRWAPESGLGPTVGAPAESMHAAPLVGRDAALSELVAMLASARAGAARTVLISGEAGIGKSRLVAEVSALAARQSVRVMVGRCHESQQQDPYTPWMELLRAARVAIDRVLMEELDRAWRRDLAGMLPELASDDEHLEDDRLSSGHAGRVFEAVVRLFQRLAARGPVLLVLEDLHWADDISLRLLATFGRRLDGYPVLVLGTARAEEIAVAGVLQRTLRELDKHDALTRLSLEALSQQQTVALLGALVRAPAVGPLGARLEEFVWRTSEGNPFVIIETVHAMGSQAALQSTLTQTAAVPFPHRVRDLIEGHLERLSPAARQLAAVAAVAGGVCEFVLLQQAAGLTERDAADALDELVRRRVLRASGERFEFAHDRIRRVAEDGLLEPAKRILHGALGDAYEALYAASAAQVIDRLAYHFARTDRAGKAVYYLTRLAEGAARAGAHERAIDALDEALMHLARRPGQFNARQRFELVFRKSRSALLLGRLDDVVRMLAQEHTYVDGVADDRLAGLYYVRLGATYSYLGDYGKSAAHSERALAAARSCGDIGTMGKAHTILTLHHFWARPDLGVRHGHDAIALLARANDSWWLGQASWIYGLNLSYRGRLSEGLQMQERAAAIGDALGDRRLQCSAAWADGFIRALAGDFERALSSCAQAVALAPDPMGRMVSMGMQALVHVERGEAQAALALLDLAIPAAATFRIPRLEGLFHGFRGEAALQAGDCRGAEVAAQAGARLTLESGYVYGRGWIERILARVARRQGDIGLARLRYAMAAKTFAEMAAPYEEARTRLELARWLADGIDADASLAEAKAAYPILSALGFESLAADAQALIQPGAMAQSQRGKAPA
ncbi:MAG: AAA family ATPase [Burkholderiales bacterium]|nr:AAA family ATPase [Burkholderiales bacterium]